MEVIGLKNAVPVEGTIKAWRMIKDKKTELIHLVLNKGETIAPHVNESDVIFYVLNGVGRITAGTEEHELVSHSAIRVEAGLTRSWINPGFTELRMLVIKELK